MPNDPYLDSSVRWKVANGQLQIREPRVAEVAASLLDRGIVTEILRPIGAGKEADVFLARDGSRLVAVKSYRLYRTANRHRGAVKADGMGWLALKEFDLLGYAWAFRAPVPEPIRREENAISMEFLGTEEGPAPQLRRVRLEEPQRIAQELLEGIDTLAAAGIVHTDLSPFNILVHRGHPWIIDLARGLRIDRLGGEPRQRLIEAQRTLATSLALLEKYFARYDVPFDHEDLMTTILRRADRFGFGPPEG